MSSTATLLLANGRVYTGRPEQPRAEAVVVAGERIAFVGSDREAAAQVSIHTPVIDLGGRFLMPGLIDAHFHLLWHASFRAGVCIDGLTSLAALQSALRAHASDHPGDGWICGRGFGYDLFPPSQPPHRRLLDAAVPDRPVLLSSYDMHTFVANTRALELAGLLRGDPAEPGVILDARGLATGELREFAALARIERSIPPLSRAAQKAFVKRMQSECHALGVTGVQNKDGDASQLALFRELEAEGELSLRIQCPLMCPRGTPPSAIADWRRREARPELNTSRVRATTVKLFYDGVIESGTACMLAPYSDARGGCGTPVHAPGDFAALVAAADAEGFQVVVHAIGDAAVRATLDAYAAVPNTRRLRHRIEHIEVLHPGDLPRFRDLGVVVSVQPIHARYAGIPAYLDSIGPERQPWCFPFRSLIEAGNNLALGSDHPVVSKDPRPGIHHALTRPKFDGSGPGSPFPDHRLTLEETLAGHTRHAAYADHAENEVGVLAPGHLADLAVFDTDPFLQPADALLDWHCALTVSGGHIVHRDGL